MMSSFKVVLNGQEETIEDTLKKTPKEHIYVAHMWATPKSKRRENS